MSCESDKLHKQMIGVCGNPPLKNAVAAKTIFKKPLLKDQLMIMVKCKEITRLEMNAILQMQRLNYSIDIHNQTHHNIMGKDVRVQEIRIVKEKVLHQKKKKRKT